MGHQLWTSPITGYRRRGTRLAELRALLGAGITAHAILEPLQSCLATASATEMAEVLTRRDFDVAGVRENPEGPVIGFVARDSLGGGTVRDHLQRLTSECLLSDATPLSGVLTTLKERERSFVLIGTSVRGIVTRADLNKPIMRVYLFGLISLLEMHLGFWARFGYPKDSWQEKLKPKRVDAAREVQSKRRNHEAASLFDSLQFCDKSLLVTARDDLRVRMALGTKKKARTLLGKAEALRNDLAHSQQDLAKKDSWKETIGLVELIEAVVHASDSEVEKEAKRSARQDPEALWASA
jgi:hypothetical protein